ncbi:hypothetical protein SLS56_012135 [Neofusicoccum ribis]|uniref:Uncharacterized protein n=1 Tax=Neofusicoccum ribis TaxID=45134 RepID=A0ABR3S9Q1_9PEZI
MEPNKQNGSPQTHCQQGAVDLRESVTSSNTSFGSFVAPEPEHEGGNGCAAAYIIDSANLLPPDEGHCAANMLNLEIVAHAHTETALQMASTKDSRLERHYAHQSVALVAWQNAYQDCWVKTQDQAKEIARLKEDIEELKAENRRLLEGISFWRDIARPASA